jgi:hypothetical protein
MTERPNLTESEISSEVDRLLEYLAWEKSPEGLASALDKTPTDPISTTLRLMLGLLQDAEDRGYNVARIMYSLMLRVWAQSEEELRDKLEILYGWSKDSEFVDRLKQVGHYKENPK